MAHYDRTVFSEEIDPTKNNDSKKCMIYCYWFFNHEFDLPNSVCNDCHDLTVLNLNISDIAIVTFKYIEYRSIIYKIIKSEAIHLLQNSALEYRGHI